jgi:Phosphoribosyl-ATP pyrophosphohydrolase
VTDLSGPVCEAWEPASVDSLCLHNSCWGIMSLGSCSPGGWWLWDDFAREAAVPEASVPALSLGQMLREAHAHFGASAPASPTTDLDEHQEAIRGDMLREEVREFFEAVADGDLAGIGKEGIDIIYVVAGTLVSFGLPVDAMLKAVHESNMTKTPAGNAKAVKGPGYCPADIAKVLGL